MLLPKKKDKDEGEKLVVSSEPPPPPKEHVHTADHVVLIYHPPEEAKDGKEV